VVSGEQPPFTYVKFKRHLQFITSNILEGFIKLFQA
jgi:hypothetical protein